MRSLKDPFSGTKRQFICYPDTQACFNILCHERKKWPTTANFCYSKLDHKTDSIVNRENELTLEHAAFYISFSLVMAVTSTLEKALCTMKSGSSENITQYVSLTENFMKRKLLSISELADKYLSRNYVMEADIPSYLLHQEKERKFIVTAPK